MQEIMSYIPSVAINDNVGDFFDTTMADGAADAPMASPLAAAVNCANKGFRIAVADLERLAQQSEEWAGKELAASHRRLYAILTECYRYYLRLKTDADGQVRKDLKKALETFIKVKNCTVKATAHDMNRIVKAVFGADRRRVSAYGIALRSALEAGGRDHSGKSMPIAAENLADWLTERGGVEEVRLGGKKGLSIAQRSDIAKRAVGDRPITTYKPDPRVIHMDTDDVDRMVLLVATYRPNGEFEINAVVRSGSAVNTALAAHYSADKDGVLSAADTVAAAHVPNSATALAISSFQAAA